MISPKLKIVRGLPGCGKSTLSQAESVSIHCPALIEADQYRYFNRDQTYRFDEKATAAAHAWCYGETRRVLSLKRSAIVANTFTQRWEMQPYIDLAKEFEVELKVVDLYDAGLTNKQLADRNTHSVPVETIADMRNRYERDWEMCNPLPPWKREVLVRQNAKVDSDS